VQLDVITSNGTLSRQVAVVAVSPAFYGYSLSGTAYAWGILPHDSGTVYVAAAGAFGPGYQSRPAKSGDLVSLYVNGLGGLGPDYPIGQALAVPYAIDKSAVAVTIDGLTASIGYAGAIYPGEYQVNITVPDVQRSGDVPIVLTVAGRTTQAGSMLTVAR
jgi:uncharacterized protein (TIGR03437 family)